MNCLSCGARLREGEKFCRKCGKPVSAAAAGSTQAKRVEVRSQEKTAQSGAHGGQPSPKKPKFDGRKIALIVSGIVVVVAIATVVLLFAFKAHEPS